MYINVFSSDGKLSLHIRNISRQMLVNQLKPLLVDTFGIPESRQRLLFLGKEMVDDLTLFDYGVQTDAIIQVFDGACGDSSLKESFERNLHTSHECHDVDSITSQEFNLKEQDGSETFSPSRFYFSLSLYRVGDVVDVRDSNLGAWFEGRVIDVRRRKLDCSSFLSFRSPSSAGSDDEDSEPIKRPRSSLDTSGESSRSSFAKRDERLAELSWDDDYEYIIRVESAAGPNTMSESKISDSNCVEEAMQLIETTGRNVRPRAQRKIRPSKLNIGDQIMINYNVTQPTRRGWWFDAVITAKRISRGQTFVYATVFVGPRLTPLKDCRLNFLNEIFALEVPGMQVNALRDGEVAACHSIRAGCTAEDVSAPVGFNLLSPDVAKPASLKQDDEDEVQWKRKSIGGSAALHFGPVDGVAVGQVWSSRAEVSASGVHRPLVAAIDGTPGEGVHSVLLLGDCRTIDVEDRGEEVVITSRRRLARGVTIANHRLGLTLAHNCSVPVNFEAGAVAADRSWRSGRPVRVVRSAPLCAEKRRSCFSPAEGLRYDGLYKVVRYWLVSEEQRCGTSPVWRFLLRRNDVAPVPWTGPRQIPSKFKRKSLRSRSVPNRGDSKNVKNCANENADPHHAAARGGSTVSAAAATAAVTPLPPESFPKNVKLIPGVASVRCRKRHCLHDAMADQPIAKRRLTELNS